MEEKSLFTLYEFLYECTSETASIEEAIFEETYKAIGKEPGPSQNIRFLNTMIHYINDQMNIWESIAARIPELDNFFSKACLLNEFMMMSGVRVPVLDTTEISKFRPDYLKEFLDQSYNLIEDAMNNKISEDDLYRIQSGDVLSKLKENLVRSKLPPHLSNKEFINFDSKKIMPVNVAFVQDKLLPQIRLYEDQRADIEGVAEDIGEVIVSGNNIFQKYLDTYERLLKGGKDAPKIPKVGFTVLGSCVHIYLEAAKYITACLLRKCHCYIFNLQQFAKLKDQLATALTSIDPIFEMAVEDSVPMIEGMLNDFMVGDSGTIEYVISKVIERGKGLIKYTDASHAPFDHSVFYKMFDAVNTTREIIQNIKAGVKTNFTIDELESQVNALESVCPNISVIINDTSVYDHAEGSSLQTGIIAELFYAKKFFKKLASSVSALQTSLNDFQDELSISEVGIFSNRVRNQEIIDNLPRVETSLYDLMRRILTGYIARIDSLSINLMENNSVDEPDILRDEDVSFMEMGMESLLDTQKELRDIEVDSIYTEAVSRLYNRLVISDPILFTERDDNPSSLDRKLDDPKPEPKEKTTNKTQSEKVTVQDGNTETNKKDDQNKEQNTDQNKDQKTDGKMEQNSQEKKDKADSILNKIIEYFKKVKDSILKYFSKTSEANTKWLKENKEYLLSRSYANCTINILDWNTNVVYTDVLNKVATNIGSSELENSIIQGTVQPSQVQNMVLNNVGLNLPEGDNLNDRLERALKTSNNAKEIATIALSDGKIKEMMPKMIEYCEYFYSNYKNEIEQAIDTAQNRCETLKNHINNKGEVSAETNVLWFSAEATLLSVSGRIMDAAKQRAENYLDAMNVLAKNNPDKKKDENNEENEGEKNENSDTENKEEPTSSQPK